MKIITNVVAGDYHIDVLLKQFTEKENFTESFSIKLKDHEEEISSEGFKALFNKMQELRPTQMERKAKRKLVFDNQSNDSSDTKRSYEENSKRLKP